MATRTVNISFKENILKEIDQFAKKESLSRSDILRIGARKYIRSLSEWRLLQAIGEAKAKKLNLKNEEDIIKKLER